MECLSETYAENTLQELQFDGEGVECEENDDMQLPAISSQPAKDDLQTVLDCIVQVAKDEKGEGDHTTEGGNDIGSSNIPNMLGHIADHQQDLVLPDGSDLVDLTKGDSHDSAPVSEWEGLPRTLQQALCPGPAFTGLIWSLYVCMPLFFWFTLDLKTTKRYQTCFSMFFPCFSLFFFHCFMFFLCFFKCFFMFSNKHQTLTFRACFKMKDSHKSVSIK